MRSMLLCAARTGRPVPHWCSLVRRLFSFESFVPLFAPCCSVNFCEVRQKGLLRWNGTERTMPCPEEILRTHKYCVQVSTLAPPDVSVFSWDCSHRKPTISRSCGTAFLKLCMRFFCFSLLVEASDQPFAHVLHLDLGSLEFFPATASLSAPEPLSAPFGADGGVASPGELHRSLELGKAVTSLSWSVA